MANRNMKELKDLTLDELKTRCAQVQGDLFKVKMEKVTGQLKNTAKIWKLRKELARIKTLQTQQSQPQQAQVKSG